MTAAALIATQLTDHSARVKMLTLAGVDVNGQVGFGGNGYHVPVESIEVDEQGPGGVSTLTFDLVDPLGAGPVPNDGDEIQYWDLVNDAPVFAGFVSNWPVKPLPSGQGRITTVSCVGFEALLDWSVLLVDLVIPINTDLQTAIQSCAAAVEGNRWLRAFGGTFGSGSVIAMPVAFFLSTGLLYSITITAGTSLREALRQVALACGGGKANNHFTPTPTGFQFTVDFYRGLRAMPDSAAGSWSSNYLGLTVADTVAGANPADTLEHETDATQIVRGVQVIGANAAGTGFLSDGSGKPGKVAVINDSTIDTADKLADAQATYLNQFVIAKRGSFDLVDWTPTAGVRPGSLLTLTDAATAATGTYRIYQITKRFLKSGRETWSITYGGLRPSATRLIRRLTRATRS